MLRKYGVRKDAALADPLQYAERTCGISASGHDAWQKVHEDDGKEDSDEEIMAKIRKQMGLE